MSEKVFYDDGKNKVTDKRFVVGNETYAIANITSVKIDQKNHSAVYGEEAYLRPLTEEEIKQWEEENKSSVLWGGSFIISFFVTVIFDFIYYGLSGFDDEFSFFVFILIWIVIAIVIAKINAKSRPQTVTDYRQIERNKAYVQFYINISTAAGETQALSSTDGAAIKQVADAINNAIIARG